MYSITINGANRNARNRCIAHDILAAAGYADEMIRIALDRAEIDGMNDSFSHMANRNGDRFNVTIRTGY